MRRAARIGAIVVLVALAPGAAPAVADTFCVNTSVKATRRTRGAKPCRRWVSAGATLQRKGLAAGARSVAFSGRIGRHRLRTDRYRATLVAIDAAGNHSTAHHLAFHIVRR